VEDNITERNKLKKLFASTSSRVLMGVWLLAKGSRFSLRALADLLSLPEDALEAKIQTFAGLGLVQVSADSQTERQIEFLPPVSNELETTIKELFEGRKNDLDAAELKIRSLVYKTLLTTQLPPP
jgi:hypothetical protein